MATKEKKGAYEVFKRSGLRANYDRFFFLEALSQVLYTARYAA